MIRSAMPDHINQQLPMSDNQIRIQLLQKLQQQQQTFFAQQSALQQPAQLIQNQEQQRQLLDVTHNSRALTPNQVFEIPPTLQNSLPGTNSMIHQMTDHSSQNNVQFSHPSKQPKLQHQPQQMQPDSVSKISSHVGLPPATTTNHLSASGSSTRTVATGTGPSV
ncbi:auxin response factor 19-like, partial [Trifolium medium]|nr:auxin response factor 19-like [Trifolium medium]